MHSLELMREQFVVQVKQESESVHEEQLLTQATHAFELKQQPELHPVHVVNEVQLLQASGHKLQVLPLRQYVSLQERQEVGPLQFMQGKEHAMQLGELGQQVSAQAVHVYPDEKEHCVQPAGQGSHPFDIKQYWSRQVVHVELFEQTEHPIGQPTHIPD